MIFNYGRWTLLPAGSVAAGTVTDPPANVLGWSAFKVYLTGNGGPIASGTIIIEEADFAPAPTTPYAGPWVQVSSIAATDATAGATKAYALTTTPPFSQLRARLSVAVAGGGSITVTLIAS